MCQAPCSVGLQRRADRAAPSRLVIYNFAMLQRIVTALRSFLAPPLAVLNQGFHRLANPI
jgi:hypothetical protein